MLADRLTPEHIKAYAAHMAKTYDIVYVTDNTKHLKDQLRQAILQVNPHADINAYFDHWAFTLGNLVWTPFSVEDPKPLASWPFYWQIITIAHEAMHRVQNKTHGLDVFGWDYLSNEESRGQYEYEAYRTGLELYPVLCDGQQLEPVMMAQTLTNYGCTSKTIEFVAAQLTAAKKIIQAGGVITETSQTTLAWLAENVQPA